MSDFEQYLATPWAATGASLEAGFNCWTLVRYLYDQHLKIVLPAVVFDAKNFRSSVNAIDDSVKLWTASTPGKFKVVLMARRTEPCHVGMYIDDSHVIHCIQRVGVIITKDFRLLERGLKIKGIYEWQQ